MSYLDVTDPRFGFFDASAAREKGKELRDEYVSAEPFPHIVIDDFCSPEILNACIAFFPKKPDPASFSFDRDQERYKTSFNPDFLPDQLRSFFYSLNSRPFVQFLENLTGVEGLIPDPFFTGGGFHETTQGGHLSVHADFNIHRKLRLERRLNVLIYLNKDWEESYGGALELWDRRMKTCVKRIVPIFNRCVVFSTNATSFHGHPAPIAHPHRRPRQSIALYYYTATWDGVARSRATQFKRRPKSEDAVDWRIKSREIIDEFLPPVLARNLRRLTRRIGI